MSFAEFLIANQAVIAPLIEWGGALVFLVIVLLPFIIIRHRFFKPVRWWTIVGAYVSSFGIYVLILYLINLIDQWLIYNYFSTFKLLDAYNGMIEKSFTWPLLIYPFLIFYSAKLMYGHLTKKQFANTRDVAILLGVAILIAFVYLVIASIGQAFMNL